MLVKNVERGQVFVLAKFRSSLRGPGFEVPRYLSGGKLLPVDREPRQLSAPE
jgi:hypothetical protein